MTRYLIALMSILGCGPAAADLKAVAPGAAVTPPSLATTIGCSNTQIVFDGSGALTCSGKFTWTDSSSTLTVGSGATGTIQSAEGFQLSILTPNRTVTNTAGSQLLIKAANGNGTGAGGPFQFAAGNGGASGNGGGFTETAGTAGASATSGTGGSFNRTAGSAAGAGNAGSFADTAGNADQTGNGGGFTWNAGSGGAVSGNAGNFAWNGASATGASNFGTGFTLTPGTGADTAHGGTITLQDPQLDNTLVIDQFGNVICACNSTVGATDQFLYIGASAGAPTGVPAHITGVYANSIPIRYDTTNNKLWAYNSGWQNPANSAQAYSQLSYQPGLVTSIVNTKSVFSKLVKTSTVDNIIGSAQSLTTCTTNPTITMYECGTSATCASPTTIGSVTITATGQAFSGTVSASNINAGDFVGWAISAGACASLDIGATAGVHTN